MPVTCFDWKVHYEVLPSCMYGEELSVLEVFGHKQGLVSLSRYEFRCSATLLNDCNETWQDLERALAVLTTRADEALKAKADAEGSLATLHHRHADMEVPLRLAPLPAVPKRG